LLVDGLCCKHCEAEAVLYAVMAKVTSFNVKSLFV
jgi:hypothetical protein